MPISKAAERQAEEQYREEGGPLVRQFIDGNELLASAMSFRRIG